MPTAVSCRQPGGVTPLAIRNWAVVDCLQRAARHLASQTDVQQAYAVGQAAVEFAVQGHSTVAQFLGLCSSVKPQS